MKASRLLQREIKAQTSTCLTPEPSLGSTRTPTRSGSMNKQPITKHW